MSTLFSAPVGLDAAQAHSYDVIVVGAGPAGSSAAYHLAKSGVDVLLMDRSSFPRDKACGDAVMPPAVAELHLMGLAEEIEKRFVAAERVGVWLKGLPGSYHPVGEHAKGYVAPRSAFDALLCEQALRHGAVWLDQVTALEVRSDASTAILHGSRGIIPVELYAQVIIAADGSGSRLARRLRTSMVAKQTGGDMNPLTPPQDNRACFTAMRGYVRGIETLSDALEFYFRGESGTHYYWIFPTGQGRANVGVIASMEQLRVDKTNLTDALSAFLQAPELEGRAKQAQFEGQLRAAPLATGLRGTALFGERMLCVGDAAALIDPQSAEGISGALWSGRVAAETVVAALKKNDFSLTSLSSYGIAVRRRYQSHYDRLLGMTE